MRFNTANIRFDIITAEVVDTCGIIRLIPSVDLLGGIISSIIIGDKNNDSRMVS